MGNKEDEGDFENSWSLHSSSENSSSNQVKQSTPAKVSARKLWSLASKWNLFLFFVGICAAAVTGAGIPVMAVIVGNVFGSFIKMSMLLEDPLAPACEGCNFTLNSTFSKGEFRDQIVDACYKYLVLGGIIYVAAFIQAVCFLLAGESMILKMRLAFFRGILHQDITWFDENNSGTLATKLFDNLERVKEGTGDKVGLLVQFSSQFFTGLVVAFTYDWKLTLIMMSLSPFLVISGMLMSKSMESSAESESVIYAEAGSTAEQALGSVRTVVAFNGQTYECQKYEKSLDKCMTQGIKKNAYVGVALGATFFIMFTSYCLSFWIGTDFVSSGKLTTKTVLTVFFSVLMGSMALGQASQQFAVIGTAQGAAAAIFEVIDREPKIDSYSPRGKRPSNLKGQISVENVRFAYPTRKQVTVCNGVSFTAEPGQTVALVGSSGCGKSTIIQMLLRYYNPDSGTLKIDGIELKELNIGYLREITAVVSQEPVLFNCSIEENILYGNERVSHAEIVQACKKANADGFISKLPLGYKTMVGDRGTQLSGGQKQRIAIARALVRNPRILLLDEATSALDAESEFIVQQALDKAREGRTTVVIAHRLSTIRNADKIVAMKDGQVVETGTHDELIARRGLYFDLVNAQTFADVDTTDETDKHAVTSRKHSVRSRSSTMATRRVSLVSGNLEALVDVVEADDTSITKRMIKDLEAEGGKEENLFTILSRARPWWGVLFLATATSIINGLVFPAFGLMFSEIITAFSTTDMAKLKRDGHFWSLMFLVCGAVYGVTAFFSSAFCGYVAEHLANKLRTDLFRNVMSMDIGYFDQDRHSSGKICTRLVSDTPNVRSALDYRLGTVISAVVTVGMGMAASFYYSWLMALVVFAVFPLAIVGRVLQLAVMKGSSEKDAADMEKAGSIAIQGIESVRTVQALTLEHKFHGMFEHFLMGPYGSVKKDAIVQGITYGFSASILFFILAICFRFSVWLILDHHTKPIYILKVLMEIGFSIGNLGFAASYFPEYKKAKLAAGILFKMLSEKSKIDGLSNEGIQKPFDGHVHFKNLHFAYPERSNVQVLKGLDISVVPGQTLALVGPSGCGKSTLVALLERFYDPASGVVQLDGVDLRERNIRHVRANMALVSQEPVLFDCSIKENIVYGLDPSTVSDEQIQKASQLANIHSFVSKLPSGYQTRVGEKGTQLSGGQKQRIAIARALIRNPKILLLDEATSALDTESEKIVQEALDRARAGRTCIVIAHRLSTVVNADCIAVCSGGVVVEKGTHAELMAMKGVYFNLTQKQLHKTTT